MCVRERERRGDIQTDKCKCNHLWWPWVPLDSDEVKCSAGRQEAREGTVVSWVGRYGVGKHARYLGR